MFCHLIWFVSVRWLVWMFFFPQTGSKPKGFCECPDRWHARFRQYLSIPNSLPRSCAFPLEASCLYLVRFAQCTSVRRSPLNRHTGRETNSDAHALTHSDARNQLRRPRIDTPGRLASPHLLFKGGHIWLKPPHHIRSTTSSCAPHPP